MIASVRAARASGGGFLGALLWLGLWLGVGCSPSGDAGAGDANVDDGAAVDVDAGSEADGDTGGAADASHDAHDAADAAEVADANDGAGLELPADAAWGDASPLALAEGWTLVDAADDPFVQGPDPAKVPCTEAAIRRPTVDDEVWLEVETLDCNAATLRAASLQPLAVGDRVEVRVWRFQLIVGDAGYELSLHAGGPGGELLWAQSLAFPGESGLWVDSHVVASAFAAGTPLWWRVRNHGVNSWNLVELSRRPLL